MQIIWGNMIILEYISSMAGSSIIIMFATSTVVERIPYLYWY